MSDPSVMPWWREPTRAQWSAYLAAWTGWVLDAFDFTVFILLMPQIAQEFGVGLTATASSLTLTLLMRLLGGLAAGAAADRWGRKLPLMVSIVWFALCDGAVAFAPDFTWVLVLRTLFGLGMGAEWTAGSALAMESWPARTRGLASGVLQGGWAVGFLLSAAACSWVVPRYGWRAMFLVAVLPALLALPIRFMVKEEELPRPAAGERSAGRVAFGRDAALKVLWAALFLGFGFAAYYAMTALYPVMVQRELGLTAGESFTHARWFNVGMLAGAIACGTLASRRGPVLAIALFALLMLPVIPLFVGKVAGALWLGALLAGVFGAGHSGVTPLLLSRIFPREVRGRAMGLAYHLGAFFSAFVPPTVAALNEYAHFTLVGSVAAIVAVATVGVLLVLLLRPRSLAV